MKKLILLISMWILCLISTAQSYSINVNEALIEFNYISEETTGKIKGVSGEIKFDPNNLSDFKFEGKAHISSINTSNNMRDKHLNSSDYFNTKLYPYITFSAKSLEKKESYFLLTGNMTIKDIVKEEAIKFTFENGVFVGRCVIYSNDYQVHEQKTREKSKILVKINVPIL
jgi:polyisoprenoid-binding protein YceI